MHQRCRVLSGRVYYAGIKVCVDWNDFEIFKQWALTHGYQEHLTIDRIKNHLGYSPDNCRWATYSEQNLNRRNYGASVFHGVSIHKTQHYIYWRAQFRWEGKLYRFGMYKTELEAAIAYDNGAFDLLGNRARLNFPERKTELCIFIHNLKIRSVKFIAETAAKSSSIISAYGKVHST